MFSILLIFFTQTLFHITINYMQRKYDYKKEEEEEYVTWAT